MSKREIRFLLEDILEAGEKIKSYTAGYSKETFFNEDKTIDAVFRFSDWIDTINDRLK